MTEAQYIELIKTIVRDVILMKDDKVDIKITSSAKTIAIEIITDDVKTKSRLIGKKWKNAKMLRNLARLISAKIDKQVMIYVE